MSDKSFKVLSIDGGGVRGIISARILQEIEEKMKRPITELFDLVVGSSTGGLMALGLNKPDSKGRPLYKARDFVDFYLKNASLIFKKTWWHRFKTGYGLWAPKYDRRFLDATLKELLGDTRLSESVGNCLVTSYSIDKERLHFWSSLKARKEFWGDYLMRDVAGATSAAPTYFSPKVITKGLRKVFYEVDGGIYSNDPEMVGLLGALSIKANLQQNQVLIVSVGTGKRHLQVSGKRVQNAGLIGWVKSHLIDMIMSGMSSLQETEGSDLLDHHYRLQLMLSKKLSPLDQSDAESIQALVGLTEYYLSERRDLIQEVCEALSQDKPLTSHQKIRDTVVGPIWN